MIRNRRLVLAIVSEDRVCGACDQRRVVSYGTRFVCNVFDDTELRDENKVPSGPGFLQRLPECLAAEESASMPNNEELVSLLRDALSHVGFAKKEGRLNADRTHAEIQDMLDRLHRVLEKINRVKK